MALREFLTIFFFLFFFTFFSTTNYGQSIRLKITADKPKEKEIVKSIKYSEYHKSEKAIYTEIDNISNHLNEIGFFQNTYNLDKKSDSLYIAKISLGKKTDEAVITIPKNFQFDNDRYLAKNDSLYIKVNEIKKLLTTVSKQLDHQGKLFSEVQLKNIQIKKNVLFADLIIKESSKRIINQIIIKPYSEFPKSFLYHYLTIKKNKKINQQKLRSISEGIKSIKFTSEIKPPEILFKKDSTLLYLYLKKKQNNSFDGLVNFATKENGSILFNGHLDLKLNNILNKGERFSLFWNSIADEVQDFKISTTIPYIFSSPLSTSLAFNIYKQDSTFLNTNFKSAISYSLNSKANIFLTYTSESSNDINTAASIDVTDFETNLIGTGFEYRIANKNQWTEDKLSIKLNAAAGTRKTNTDNTNQIKIQFDASYIWQLNYRNSIYLKNETSYLNSDSYLTNELFRIGGANSIRGFDEQSIFTSKYSYFNIEYRYLTSETSYLFSITDFGSYKNLNEKNIFLTGIGIGYTFITNNNTFKLSYAIGKNQEEEFYVNKSKLIINWIINF